MPHRPQTLYPAHAQQHPAVTGGNVAILSADNPRFPAEMQGAETLQQELDRLGLDYELTRGKYGAPEQSFIISNPELPIVLDLARRFGQESVAYSQNGRHQLHFVNGPQAGMATAPVEGHEWHDDEPQDNYTAVPSPYGDPLGYFTWNMDFSSPMVSSTGAPVAQPAPSAPAAPSPSVPAQGTEPLSKSLADDINEWMERLGALRTKELAKALPARAAPPPAPVQGVTVAPGVAVKPEIMRALASVQRVKAKTQPEPAMPGDRPSGRAQVMMGLAGPVRKSDYDAGSAISMVQGDMSHNQSQHGGPMKKSGQEPGMKSESSKVDPLDADMAGKHACKGCGSAMSPVVAALRKSKGGVCLKCEGSMAKGELPYHNNEPQHNDADRAWKPKVKASPENGSGGQVKKNPVGNSSNPGAASGGQTLAKSSIIEHLSRAGKGIAMAGALAGAAPAMGAGKATAPAPRPAAAQQTRVIQHHAPSGPFAAGTTTPVADVRASKPPMVADARPPMPVIKAEGGMSTPKAPGAGAMGATKPAAGGSSPPKMMPLGRSEGSSDANLTKPSTSGAQHRAMAAAASGKSTLGIPKSVGKEFLEADKGKKFKKTALHKALEEQVTLRKTSVPGGMNVAAQHGAAMPAPAPQPQRTQPAPAFHPASPGAAGPTAPPKPQPTLKQGLPIAKLKMVRGAPLSKPKV